MSLIRGFTPRPVRRTIHPVSSPLGSIKRQATPRPIRKAQYARHPGGTATTSLGRWLRRQLSSGGRSDFGRLGGLLRLSAGLKVSGPTRDAEGVLHLAVFTLAEDLGMRADAAEDGTGNQVKLIHIILRTWDAMWHHLLHTWRRKYPDEWSNRVAFTTLAGIAVVVVRTPIVWFL